MNFRKVILLISLLLLVLACGNSPESAVTGLLNAMKEGDVQQLCEYAPRFGEEMGYLSESEVEELFPAKPDMSWKILTTELSFNGESATVKVEILDGTRPTTSEYIVILVEDKWVVSHTVRTPFQLH